MLKEIKMPKLGQTVDEYTVTVVNKTAGDEVEMGDVLIEVETDKSTMPVESYADGVIVDMLVNPGDIIKDGDVIATLEAEDD